MRRACEAARPLQRPHSDRRVALGRWGDGGFDRAPVCSAKTTPLTTTLSMVFESELDEKEGNV